MQKSVQLVRNKIIFKNYRPSVIIKAKWAYIESIHQMQMLKQGTQAHALIGYRSGVEPNRGIDRSDE